MGPVSPETLTKVPCLTDIANIPILYVEKSPTPTGLHCPALSSSTIWIPLTPAPLSSSSPLSIRASSSPCLAGSPTSISLPGWARPCLDLGSVILPCFFQKQVRIPGGVKTHLLAFPGSAVTSFLNSWKYFSTHMIPFGCQATSLFWRAGYISWRLCLASISFPTSLHIPFSLRPSPPACGFISKQLRKRCSAGPHI